MNERRKTCAECGAELGDDAMRGLCPRCLLQVGLGSQTDPDATVAVAGGSKSRRALPEIGGKFGPYRILSLLGRGGMGVVYEVEEQETGRRLALKVLGRKFDSPSDRARFLREGRLAASINHPNSVYVYGTDEIEDTPTIAMEIVSGGTLQQRVENQGPMPVTVAVDTILEIISGLEGAQAIGILHRDIKPGNCFEDAGGAVKIGDFGLSISTSARVESNITAEGAMVGTPAFCSPEQLRGDDLNVHSDMYSVGATLFYLLTGRPPLEGHNLAQLTANVLEKPAPSPRELRKEVPKGLSSIIQRCLAKQPADRFKSYGDLRQALAPYGSTAPTPATLSLRFLAGVLDMLVIGLVGAAIFFLCFGSMMDYWTLVSEGSVQALFWMLGSICTVLLYYAIFEGLWGAAAGKAICRLRIVRPDKNPPGFLRALLRALIYVVLPALPSWIVYGSDPKAALQSSMVMQQLIGFSFYLLLALLFCTARRRNGFASMHDLITKTRVISRTALEIRPVLAAIETPPPAVEDQPTVGPYHVLETLETNADGQWILCYDLRLLRKVWIHTVPPGTPPMDTRVHKVGRVGRLRWLTGRRSPEENWDAFEGVSGKPLLKLIADRQPWSQVRFWLYDLASEIGAAEKDGTLPPVLALDRVWITGDGRAKLLDFPAPGVNDVSTEPILPETGNTQRFLSNVAVTALEGQVDSAEKTAAEVAVTLPLHARKFLERLSQFPDADTFARELKPLLKRVTSVSRLRRAAVVAGCGAFPVLMSIFMIFAIAITRHQYPGILELQVLLQQRQMKIWGGEKNGGVDTLEHKNTGVTDRQIAIFIASHYRESITNKAIWNSPVALSGIKGDDRRFAEQSVADYPAPTKEEIDDADAALNPYMRSLKAFEPHPFLLTTVMLAIYVGLPACIAAILFRGGLVLFLAGVAYVRGDGKRASRLRVFWRALVAWSPLWLGLLSLPIIFHSPNELGELQFALICGLFLALAIISVALPKRGLPDRLAGTWPVPR